jgi:hypothetical protein
VELLIFGLGSLEKQSRPTYKLAATKNAEFYQLTTHTLEVRQEHIQAIISHDHHSDAICPTPATPRRVSNPRFSKARVDSGCHAVGGTKRSPYMTLASEIRFIEIAAAMGAPMNPSLTESGPHTTLSQFSN